MPNMLPSLLYLLFMWSAFPHRFGNAWREDWLAPFPWRRIVGAFLGLTAGTISLAPTALASPG